MCVCVCVSVCVCPQAKLICDLGVQMLNEELEEPPTQTAPARCVALMETMLRLAK